jgi:hypothetical protein
MRFKIGQVYERSTDGAQAVIIDVRSEGRQGRLRFLHDRREQWFLWAQLHQFGAWRLLGPTEEAAN